MEPFYFLDLFGTAAFAITGALKSFKYKLDLLGVLVLGLATGVGGGTIRELLLGHTPPFLLTDFNYLYVAVAASLLTFIFHGKIETRQRLFYTFDAIGLGVFTAVGSLAGQTAGLGSVGIGFLAVLTACGGGVIRDIFIGEIPLVFRREIYASAAIAGTIIFQILLKLEAELTTAMLVSSLLVTVIRLISIQKSWNLPRAN